MSHSRNHYKDFFDIIHSRVVSSSMLELMDRNLMPAQKAS